VATTYTVGLTCCYPTVPFRSLLLIFGVNDLDRVLGCWWILTPVSALAVRCLVPSPSNNVCRICSRLSPSDRTVEEIRCRSASIQRLATGVRAFSRPFHSSSRVPASCATESQFRECSKRAAFKIGRSEELAARFFEARRLFLAAIEEANRPRISSGTSMNAFPRRHDR
jgi:hypothetical protein